MTTGIASKSSPLKNSPWQVILKKKSVYPLNSFLQLVNSKSLKSIDKKPVESRDSRLILPLAINTVSLKVNKAVTLVI